MVGGGMGTLWICYALLSEVFAGPLHRVPRESEDYQNDLSMYANYTANEVCFSEGEVFQKGDVMPNPGPCEECRCEPPSIVCNMIKCPTNNNGCRTIQRANHCCPDYNCECDYNGQLYNDGERLDLPEEPCQVCYCKGGEVMCNSITCYHRDDCDPIQVAGQCCPKYENCPVRDMGSSSSEDKNVLVRSANKTNYVPPKREMNPWLLTKLPPASSLPPSKTSQDSTTEGGSVIIVSDWLTERRTTTEDAANSDVGRSDYNLEFTDEPDLFTIPDHLTTEMKQDNNSDRSVIMKNLDTITPVDEVIFTRIDGQNESNEVKMEDQSIFSKKNQENITQILAQVNSTISNISDTLDSTTKVSEDLKRNILSASSLEKVPILIFSSETMANYETSTKPTKKIIEPWRNGGVSSLSQEMKVSSTDSTNTQFNIDSRDVKKGVILGNIFGLDGLSLGGIEPETTTKDLFEYHTTVNGESKYDFKELTENSLEEKINEHFKGEKIKISLGDGPNNRTDTTISGTTDKVITISSSTDFSSKTENKNKNEYPTDLDKIKEENSSNSSNEPITPISGRDEATNANTSSQLSDPLDIKSFGDIKTKRNNFNVSRITYDSVKNSTISILFDNKGYTDSPPTAQETLKVLKDDTKLENVVLGYESINTSEVSPNNLDEGSTLPTTVSSVVESISDFESTADTVMELNSLVPFLQLGDHEHDQTTVDGGKNIEVVLIDSNSNATSSIDSNNQSVSQKIEQGSVKNENITTDTTMETVYPTTHLPLRPGDLKVIAEYLINDTIKTIQINNISHYVPDPWLQGNLTSVESMNSILTAANVSIAIMNKTNDKVKRVIPESTTRPIEVTSLENYEKENNLSDNSALNFLKIANKTGHFGGKIEEYSNYPKYNSDQYTLINDEVKSSKTENLENSEIITQLVKSSVEHSISNEKENITSISNLERRFNQGSSDTDRRFDSVNPAGNFETRQIEKRGFSTKKKTSNVTTASATSSQPQKDQ